MSSTALVLLGLAAGLVLGLAASATAHPALHAVADGLAPVGTLFINAVRMTVVPLVVSKLVVGIAARAGDTSIGRLGGSALSAFAILLLVAAIFAVAVAMPVLSALPLDTSMTGASAGVTGSPTAASLLSVRQWLEALVPSNVVGAAEEGAMLPLIVFAVLLGLALGQVSSENRETVVRFFDGLGDAMLVIVRWVLRLAPIGVFALAVPMFTRLGLTAVGALAAYVALVAIVTVTFSLLVLYPLAMTAGGVELRRFARAIAPAQVVAFSSRSSLASLPVMMESGARLSLPEPVVGFFLPLAASVFRVGSVMGTTIAALFVARLYGIIPDVGQVAMLVATAVVVGFGSPGVPSGSILISVPILASIGVPTDAVGLLLGVDAIPDMLRTTANITGNMAVACVLARNRDRIS